MVSETIQRWLYPLVAVVLGAALFLPALGRHGLWDPHEIKIADQARDVHRWSQQHAFDVTAGGKYRREPPLPMWFMSRSLGALGVSETGARLPFALISILGLLVVYFAGASLFSRRAGLLAAIVLASCPGYLLQARQVLSDVLLVVPSAAAVLGAVILIWPRSGKHSVVTLVGGSLLTLTGLALAYLSGGALVGVVIPLGAVALAGLLSLSSPAAGAEPGGTASSPLALVGVGPHFPADKRALSGAYIQLAIVGVAFLVIAGLTVHHVVAATRYSPLVGAIPGKARTGVITWTYFLQQVGFSFFPMSALAPFAFGRLLFKRGPESGRLVFAKILITSWAALAFFVGTLWLWRYGDLRFPALPALAIGIGALLDDVLSDEGEPDTLLAFGTALCAAILARDLFLYPEYLATNHLLDTAKWPTGVHLKIVFVAFGLLFAAGSLVAFSLRRRLRRIGLIAAHALVALSLATGGTIAYVVTPELSKHYSRKVLFDRFRALRRSGEPLAQYRAGGRGMAYYTRGEVKEISSQPALLTYLKSQQRSFVIVPADQLGQIDQATRAANVPYYVVDDTSSRFLLLSNRLDPGQQDRNVLRKLVRQTPPTPQHRVSYEFDNKIALLGYDLPPELSRGHEFTITLHFHVKEKPRSGFKIFLHFDGPGTRFNGDHDPLAGKFPTKLWSAGDYISDPHTMTPERATTPTGEYTVWMGFWPGGSGKRLPVTTGSHDGSHRVRLGKVKVK